MPRLPLSLGALLALALAVPAGASAATIQTTPSCVRYFPRGAAINVVRGTAFSPNTPVRVAWAGGGATSLLTRADGSFAGLIPGPRAFSFRANANLLERTFSLSAVDQANPALRASIKVRAVRFTVRLPGSARPSTLVRYRLFGFPHRPVRAFYASGGHVKASRLLGTPRGPCGTLTHRQRLLPIRTRSGLYPIYFAAARRLTARDIRGRRYLYVVSYRVRRVVVPRAHASARRAR